MALHLKLRETYVLRRKNVKESFSLMNNYYEQKQHQQSIKLNSTLAKLPQFCRQFIIGIKNTVKATLIFCNIKLYCSANIGFVTNNIGNIN